MRPSELTEAIRTHLRDNTAVVHDMTDNGGFGLVRWSHDIVAVGGPSPVIVTEHVVHRWAVKDTADNDIPFMLYSGGYYEDDVRDPAAPKGEDLARNEYRRRADINGVAPRSVEV